MGGLDTIDVRYFLLTEKAENLGYRWLATEFVRKGIVCRERIERDKNNMQISSSVEEWDQLAAVWNWHRFKGHHCCLQCCNLYHSVCLYIVYVVCVVSKIALEMCNTIIVTLESGFNCVLLWLYCRCWHS